MGLVSLFGRGWVGVVVALLLLSTLASESSIEMDVTPSFLPVCVVRGKKASEKTSGAVAGTGARASVSADHLVEVQ